MKSINTKLYLGNELLQTEQSVPESIGDLTDASRISALENGKQDMLTPGNGINIDNSNNITNTSVLTGTTAPITATEGYVGQFYLDTVTTKLYKCDAIISGDLVTYTWSEVGGSQKYLHSIMLYNLSTLSPYADNGKLVLKIINDSNTTFTFTTLKSYISNTLASGTAYEGSGAIIYDNADKVAFGVTTFDNGTTIELCVFNSGATSWAINENDSDIYDNVVLL